MIVGAHNWIVDLDGLTEISTPTSALDYDQENLWSGGTARAWRSISLASFLFRFRLGTQRPVGLAALFGVRASGGATIDRVTLRRDSIWPTLSGIEVAEITLNSRGDGMAHLPIPITDESWALWVELDTPALLTVGGLWIGEAAVLPAPAQITRARQGNRISNVSEGMTHRATRVASSTRILSVSWPPLERADAAAVEAAFDAVADEGGLCVLAPDESDGTEVYYGQASDAVSASIDAGTQLDEGLAIDFEEDGRALGV